MSINDILKEYHLSQTELSRKLNIPLRTIQDWAGDKRTPSEWVVDLINKAIKQEKEIKIIMNREKLYNNILNEFVKLLDFRADGQYSIADDMSLVEDPNGILEISASAFCWSDYETALDMVSDFRSDDPIEIKAEIIRVFFAEDEEEVPDMINDAIEKIIAGEPAIIAAK